MEYLDERDMVGKAISSTYKGILRVANNLNLIDYTTDTFLSKDYYTSIDDNAFYGNGTNSVYDFLSSGNAIKRFKSENSYFNLKLPVTDSMGHFMNFYLGDEGSTIGTYSETGKYIDGREFNFSTLQSSNPIQIGLEERKAAAAKTIKGGSLNIDFTPDSEGALVIENKHHYQGTRVVSAGNKKVRTIFPTNLSSTPPKKFDFLYYSQEDYNYESNNDSTVYKDCKISIKNLSDYVRIKVDNYLSNNEAPVPTGTIINQYCSLDKWFCWDASSGEIDDFGDSSKKNFDGWQGYRPSMYNQSTPFAYFNLINNRAINTDSQLKFNGKRTTELPPDFKRGYILCDGGPLTFNLSPSSMQGKDDEQDSLRLFFDLFYTIGYYYHNDKAKVPVFHQAIKQNDDSYRYGEFTPGIGPDFVSWSKVNFDVAYGITMATVLIFKALDNEYTKNKNSFETVDKVLEWLQTQSIDENYIFNVISPEELKETLPNNYFKYTNSSLGSKTFYINIGREIKSFNDKIPYYEYDRTNKTYKLTTCPIWKTAEAYHLAELFINRYISSSASGIASRQGEWDKYRYTFYVPQLYTQTDKDANLAAQYYDSEKENIKIGSFLGSNGLSAAKTLTIYEDNVQTINLEQNYSQWQSNYRNFIGYVPHVHAVGKGRLELKYGTLGNTPENSSLVSAFMPPKLSKNIILNPDEEKTTVLKTDYRGTGNISDKFQLPTDMMNNYVLFEVPDSSVSWKEVANSFSGSLGQELQNGTFKWYGRTSEPIWATNDISKLTVKFESQETHPGYFRPESINVLPLIKL